MRFSFLILFFFLSYLWAQNSFEVRATGYSKENAIEKARKAAVHKKVAEICQKTFKTPLPQTDIKITEKFILKEYKSHFARFEIQDEQLISPSVFNVSVRVEFKEKLLTHRLSKAIYLLAKINKETRLGIYLPEEILGKPNAQRIVQIKLVRYFLNRRFSVLTLENLNNPPMIAALKAKDASALEQMRNLPDLVIFGKVQGKLISVSPNSIPISKYLVSMEAEILEMPNLFLLGKAQISRKSQATEMSHNKEIIDSFKLTAEEFGNTIMVSLLRSWMDGKQEKTSTTSNAPAGVQLLCEGVQQADFSRIENKLKSIPEITSFKQVKFEQNRVEYQLEFGGKISDLARKLNKLKIRQQQILKIKKIKGGQIILKAFQGMEKTSPVIVNMRWDIKDVNFLVNEMSASLLKHPMAFKNPAYKIRVGKILNKTSEPIDTKAITMEISKILLTKGAFRILASMDTIGGFSDTETKSTDELELELEGELTEIKKGGANGPTEVAFQCQMRLKHLISGKIVWKKKATITKRN